jgi:hypothetical protein
MPDWSATRDRFLGTILRIPILEHQNYLTRNDRRAVSLANTLGQFKRHTVFGIFVASMTIEFALRPFRLKAQSRVIVPAQREQPEPYP